MAVIRKIIERLADGTKKETPIGALGKHVKIDEIQESTASFPAPAVGDTLKTLPGKIKKWETDCLAKFGNYVLKSMLTSQQINSTDKVPTSALVYAMQQAIAGNTSSISELNAKAQFDLYELKILDNNIFQSEHCYISLNKASRLAYLYIQGTLTGSGIIATILDPNYRPRHFVNIAAYLNSKLYEIQIDDHSNLGIYDTQQHGQNPGWFSIVFAFCCD